MIENNENDFLYIGSTINNIKKRFNQHIYNCNKTKKKHYKLYKAMNLYGSNQFNICLIKTYYNITNEQLKRKEKYYIKKFDSIDNGYNTRMPSRTSKENYIDKHEYFLNKKKELIECDKCKTNISRSNIARHKNKCLNK